jgi:hypothetical protein
MTTPATPAVALAGVVSTDRWATYESACQGDQNRATRLYAWNIETTAALWGGFHLLEVALRNTIHRQLTALAGREDWWAAGTVPLHPYEQQKVRTALSQARQDHGGATQPGHVVAELTLGFWTALLATTPAYGCPRLPPGSRT